MWLYVCIVGLCQMPLWVPAFCRKYSKVNRGGICAALLSLRGDMVVQIDFFSLSNQDFAFRVI